MTAEPIDVLIAGGGLAGLTLALQLRRDLPELRVVVVEKRGGTLPDACHKVGESSVELGSHYLESLGLKQYLADEHIFKHGLRFFPGGGERPLEQRTEIGPAHEPIVPSYQLDRGKLENDLRALIVARGAELIAGASLRGVTLNSGDEPHEAVLRTADGDTPVRAHWLIDATGRSALLRKDLKLTRGNKHAGCASWFRVRGKVDINDLVPSAEHAGDAAAAQAWHEAGFSGNRWRSTSHLMGHGYWVWIIPLSTGNTSIGVVAHADVHPFEEVRTLANTQAFLHTHQPVLAKHLDSFEVLDFAALKSYSHGVGRAWSTDRWAMVGEAGAFVDPLYSPGTDFIAFANLFTGQCIAADVAHDRSDEHFAQRVFELNMQYRALVSGTVDIYREAAPVYGHAAAMLSKVYWDNYAYWCFPCQYYMQGIYKLTGSAHSAFSEAGQRFVQLSNYVQALLREWALCDLTALDAPIPKGGFHGMPAFPSILVDTHLALRNEMTPNETLAYIEARALEGETIVAELLIRVLFAVGQDHAARIVDTLDVHHWRLSVSRDRILAEPEVGLARRRALSKLARDVERTCGRVHAQTPVDTVLDLLAAKLVDGNGDYDVPPVTPAAEVMALVAGVVPVS